MSHMRKYLLLIATVFVFQQAQAQTSRPFSGWGAVFSTTKLDNRFSLHFDGQVRSSDKLQRVQTILLRPGLNYKVNKNQVATIGYAFINNSRTIGTVSGWSPEHRIWEQYIINQSFKIGGHATSLQHRFRLEQRFIANSIVANNALKTDGTSFAQRLRYFARGIFPLKPVQQFTQGTFISLQNEIMFNIGDAAAVNGKFFDQNRAYGSFGYRFSPKADLEIGYMNQFVSGRGSVRTSNNILQVAAYLRL
ncbi:Protein of unknown function [Sediminibacterium ginsengisoli]|uniref:DUF2490 domain-containing protein n=2 Tax=Sediminibacterium ginsengisoli TaxID=413434 RepID=A0A1T4MCB1_9BACT|nr:Protein of unknown function [Sediminibacterium ginsengisoli]